MKDFYQCTCCGETFSYRTLERTGRTHCRCGKAIPKGLIKRWRAARPKRTFHLECLCGKTYKITPPEGDFKFICKKCKRLLLSIKPRNLNGITLPRYIEEAQEREQAQ